MKNLKISVTTFASLLLASVVANAQGTVPTLTLKQAVEIALAKNPATAETKEKINQSEAAIPAARATILPNLSAVAIANRTKDESDTGGARFGGDPYNSYNAGLRLSQQIFQLGALDAIDSVKKDRDLSTLNYEISNRDLTVNVVQAYFNVVLQMRNVETLQREQKIVRDSLSAAEQRFRMGRTQFLDVLQIKTQIALLDAKITDAQSQLQIAAMTLSSLLGGAINQEVKVKDTLEAPAIENVDHQVNLSQYRILELERNTIALEQTDDQKQILLGQNLPNVTLSGQYNFNAYEKSSLFDQNANSWVVGLQLTIPIFSGLSSFYQRRGLLSQQAQQELDRINIKNNTNLQQVTSRKKLESANQAIISGEEALKLAVASSNEARKNYRYSNIDFVQFLTVQQSYVEAESSLNASKYNYISALASYYSSSGQDMSRLVTFLEGVN